VGELWTGDDLVLAHEFRFGRSTEAADNGVEAASPTPPKGAHGPPKGAHGPPSGTVSRTSKRVGDAFVPISEQSRSVLAERASGGAAGRRSLDPSELVDRFLAFFAGDDPDLDEIPIDLDWATPFQHAVATAVRGIRRGEIVSYGELAALAGYPGAARAAGTFCAHNRFMLILPCHRVVGATGIGGYGSAGAETKRRLLALEGVVV
jgi:methylated-DNA-[protein]-cysteine S-methyltransferase